MSETDTLSSSAETAMSYLEDVEEATKQLDREDNHLTRARKGEDIISGDLRLARSESEKAESWERLTLEAMCFFREGMIRMAIARGHSEFYSLPEEKKKTQTALVKACEAFTMAINANPRPVYYYNAALVYAMLDRKAEAVQMFEQAANGDDPKVAVEARKEIGRIGPINSPAKAIAVTNGDGRAVFVSKKKTDWGAAIKGIIAAVVGLALIHYAIIAVPVLLWGAWMLYVGFGRGIDS